MNTLAALGGNNTYLAGNHLTRISHQRSLRYAHGCAAVQPPGGSATHGAVAEKGGEKCGLVMLLGKRPVPWP